MNRCSSEATIDDHFDRSTIFHQALPIIRRIARIRASNVVKVCGLSLADQVELEQDATLRVWLGLRIFDPSRASPRTFIERIVANEMASFVRRHHARKRQVRRDVLFDEYLDSGGEDANLRIDVARVVQQLPPEQQTICRLLSRLSPTEVSRLTGRSRASVYRTIDHLRRAFVDAGLGDAFVRGAR